jgi:hypothetical protein
MTTVMFDIDGILANFNYALAQLAKAVFHVTLPNHPDKVRCWDYALEVLTAAQHHQLWNRIHDSQCFWSHLPSLLERKTWCRLRYFQDKGNLLYFVTGRTGIYVHLQTTKWLTDMGIYAPQVICISRKGEAARLLGAHYAIDDKAGNAIAISYMAPECKAYILDRPYNQFSSGVIGRKVQRVKTVEEFLSDVEKGA